MSYTNVNTEHFTHSPDRLHVEKLEVELKFWQREAEQNHRELVNILEAIDDHGHVDIKHGGKTVRLIKADQPSGDE